MRTLRLDLATASRGRRGDRGALAVCWLQGRGPGSRVIRPFSLYERPGVLIENPFRSPKSIAELGSENVLALISGSMFVERGVTYPPMKSL